MKIAGFGARADLVGRRIVVYWTFELDAGETLAQLPRVRLRRKRHDFEFQPLAGPGDPTLVYDSAAFPAPGDTLTELPAEERVENGLRRLTTVDSAARSVGGQLIEVRRRTTTTTFDSLGRPLRQAVELLDTGPLPQGLHPGVVYYYELTGDALPDADPQATRAVAAATDSHGLARAMYDMLPAVYRRHDVRTRPPTPGGGAIPEMAAGTGQLRRFVDLFGVALDNMRSSAEALRTLHELDDVDYRFLPLLARWIGWDLSRDTTIPVQRNEIRAAPALYRDTGTIPNLRAVVNYYSGWHSQVAEFAQALPRAGLPPQLNLYALESGATGWRDLFDAAPALGFTPGSDLALGGVGAPAELVSALAEPFALRPGSRLVLIVDNGLPEVVQFWPDDFLDMDHATAAELAHVLNRLLVTVEATPTAAGQLRLRTYRRGSGASIEVRAAAPSPLSLEGAPAGRLAPLADTLSRIRLFYSTAETDPDLLPPDMPPDAPRRRLRYKTFHANAWRDSRSLPPAAADQGEPAALSLPGGRTLLFWIERPDTAQALIRMAEGQDRPVQRALLTGRRTEPFPLAPGRRIAFRFDHTDLRVCTFQAGDFASPGAATAAEVVAALNARVPGLQAAALSNRALSLSTTSPTTHRFEVDLAESDAAQELGFSPHNSAAETAWDDVIDWGRAIDAPGVPPGRIAGLHAVRVDDNTLWLFWAAHNRSLWQIWAMQRTADVWNTPQQLAGHDIHTVEPAAAADTDGRVWLFYTKAQPGAPSDDRWLLHRRLFDPAPAAWGAEEPVTTPGPGPHTADRQPAPLLLPDGSLRLYFRSDRNGGPDLWSVNIAVPGGLADTPQPVTETAEAEHTPAPLALLGDRIWLFFRSDRSVPLAQAAAAPPIRLAPGALESALPNGNGNGNGSRPIAAAPAASLLLADTGTARRFDGSVSLQLSDLRRLARMGRWDDLLTYTPQKVGELGRTGALVGGELYTPNTVGIYIGRIGPEAPLTQRRIERLRQVLERAVPVNMRAVIVLAPRVHTEYVYEAGAANDIQESYRDDFPYVEYLTGLLDSTVAALPDWMLLLASQAGHLSADPAALASLRRRTYFPPPL